MRRTIPVFAALLLLAGCTAPQVQADVKPQPPTVTVLGGAANIYGAQATETTIGTPMPLSGLTDTVVVVLTAGKGTASCEIDSAGQRVAYQQTWAGMQAVCIWNRK